MNKLYIQPMAVVKDMMQENLMGASELLNAPKGIGRLAEEEKDGVATGEAMGKSSIWDYMEE